MFDAQVCEVPRGMAGGIGGLAMENSLLCLPIYGSSFFGKSVAQRVSGCRRRSSASHRVGQKKGVDVKKSKKTEKKEVVSLVDIPSDAKDRLEVVLEVSGPGIARKERIIIGLDDGAGHLSLAEARKLSEIILEMSRPKFDRLFGDYYPYQVSLFVGGKQHILLAPNGGENDDRWRLIQFDENSLPF
jgi:hypothetical protein